jgi:hypothetical protein
MIKNGPTHFPDQLMERAQHDATGFATNKQFRGIMAFPICKGLEMFEARRIQTD